MQRGGEREKGYDVDIMMMTTMIMMLIVMMLI